MDKEEIAKNTYGFGKLEVNSTSARSAYYRFVLRYHPDGMDGDPECFVWYINDSVSNFAPVQLVYSVQLTNPQSSPGTYGVYDADGSDKNTFLMTNLSATLYPVDSNGVNGAPETFAKPTVSYTIADPTITVTFKPGEHGDLSGVAAGADVSYSDVLSGSDLENDQTFPRVVEDNDWDFTSWRCTASRVRPGRR